MRLGGLDKSVLTYGGLSFIDRITKLSLHLSDRVAWVGKEVTVPWIDQVDTLHDDPLLKGQLGGSVAAMKWAIETTGREWVWLFACDMPLIDLDLVIPLAKKAEAVKDQTVGCVLYQDRGSNRLHPLCALWKAEAALAYRSRISSMGLKGLARELGYAALLPQSQAEQAKLMNINRPEDLVCLKVQERT